MVGFIVLSTSLAACTASDSGTPSAKAPNPTASTDPAAGDHELEWVFGIAEEAGFEVQEVSRGAPTIVRGSSTFQMWASVSEDDRDRAKQLGDEGYEPVGTVGGIRLFSDGQRLTWEINGIFVWLSGVEGIDGETRGVADLVQASTVFAWDGGLADDADRRDQLTERVGQVACHDGLGDLMGEGSGDQSGPGPQAPDEQHDGTDLTGFSMGRYRDGTFEMSFGTRGPIPERLDKGQKLSFVLTGTSKTPGYRFASITTTLRGGTWKVLIRNEDDDGNYPIEPEVAGNGLNLIVDAELVPRLMRGSFRWHVFSQWMPEPTRSASQIYSDYCPDTGFPKFGGHSS
jgi:hypothetical protein